MLKGLLGKIFPKQQAESDEMLPPKKMIFVGHGDFKKTGEEFLEYFKRYGLKPNDKVLDVGAGIGRMAIPLTKYLSASGSYDGIDIVPKGIEWCQEKITPRYSNFRFYLANIYNKLYNPKGKFKASEYQFEFNDAEFDFIFLTSVFTHMLPDDMENYLSEISRVLKKGGKCFITYFLLNNESETLMKGSASRFDFQTPLGECYYDKANKRPEDALAYKESFVKKLFETYGLRITDLQLGSWCGREQFLTYQDVIVAEK